MRSFQRSLSLTFILMISVIAISIRAQSNEAVGGAEWKARMNEMLSDVWTLIPFAFNEAKFNDKQNAATIEKSLTSLEKHSANLKAHTESAKGSPNTKIDPSYSYIADTFQRQVSLAQELYSRGEGFRPRAQAYARSAISKCMACHTQSSAGPTLKLEQFKGQLEGMSTPDRFVAYSATRQFDDALLEFKKYVQDATKKKPETQEFDRMARAALAMSIRVKDDPSGTKDLVKEINASGAGSTVLRSDLGDWLRSIEKWSNEGKVTKKTDEQLFTQANKLVKGATNKPLKDRVESPDVDLLRASGKLHDLLLQFPKSSHRAESFLLLATIYDRLPGYSVWDLNEEYLETCIQENPHTPIAGKCFAQYKDTVVIGYTGSSGTHLPAAVRTHLNQLEELAKDTSAQKKK